MPSNQPSHTLSISEAAEVVGVTIHSVRRWAEWHSAHLDPGANPDPGQPKRFTGRDIEVLRHVKALRGEGLQTIAINDKLAGLTFAEIEPSGWPDGTPNNSNAIATDSEGIEPEASADARQGQEGAILALQVFDAINAQNRKIEALERSASEAKQSQREYIQGVAVGFIGAAMFFLILLLLISIYQR